MPLVQGDTSHDDEPLQSRLKDKLCGLLLILLETCLTLERLLSR